MRRSPSIAPGRDQDTYLVLDDFGRLGRAWSATDVAGASRSTPVRDMLDGQYENPVRIIAFNTAEGWSRDVTVDIERCWSGVLPAPRNAPLASSI